VDHPITRPEPTEKPEAPDFEVLSLWDDRAHPVAAGTSYEADF
jgi:hypothetical protein